MTQMSKILAQGILTSAGIEERLATAFDSNLGLIKFLSGDTIKPTVDQATTFVQNNLAKDRTLTEITNITLNHEFEYEIFYTYSFIRYVKDEQDNRYNAKSSKSEEYSIEKTFYESTYITYRS